MNTKQWYLGLLGFLGFLGVSGLFERDWLEAIWLVWFVWFIYFIPHRVANPTQETNKKQNLAKIHGLFEQQERISNDDVERFLGVSDATATRYLDELEHNGAIRQVGRTGRFVYYEKR